MAPVVGFYIYGGHLHRETTLSELGLSSLEIQDPEGLFGVMGWDEDGFSLLTCTPEQGPHLGPLMVTGDPLQTAGVWVCVCVCVAGGRAGGRAGGQAGL